MSAYCPECDAEIDIDSADAEIGDELSCSECGSLLRVSNDSPLELEFADDDDSTTMTTTRRKKRKMTTSTTPKTTTTRRRTTRTDAGRR